MAGVDGEGLAVPECVALRVVNLGLTDTLQEVLK
jgi:hypothetical protein